MSDESAFGGSAKSLASGGSNTGWHERRLLAGAIRLVVFALPILAAIVIVRLCSPVFPRPDGFLGWVGWLGASGVTAVATVSVVDSFARRLLPLATLFRMSLVFPDETPSRMKLALRTGTARDLHRRISDGESLGETADEAAQNLLVLLRLLNDHDRLTRGHSERVRAYSDLIAEEMELPVGDRALLHWGALAHDVGKLSVTPELLNKPGRPTDEEWRQLRNHPLAAFELAAPLRPWLGSWVDAATQHHERYDGDGYPLGLSGDDIHISGRIVAVADAFDTMTSARSYKKPLPFEEARAELTRASGSQFDPEVVRSFMTVGVRRLRLVGGPLAWLTSLPGATAVTTVTTTSGGAGAALAGAALAVSTVVGLGVPTTDERGDGLETAGIERAIDGLEDTGGGIGPVSGPMTTVTTADENTEETAATTTAAPTTTEVTTTTAAPTTTTTTAAPTTTRATATPPTTTAAPTTTTAAPGVGQHCAAVQEGLRPLTGLDLVNCDLSGLDLTDQSLVDADMDGADLTGAVLAGATFTGGEFGGVLFTNADLRNAILRDADFDASVFDGADLTAADMRNADFDDASFVGADLTDAQLSGSGFESVDFTDALLVRVRLGNANLQGADLTRARLTAATGIPNDHDLAIWVNTECPNGVVQSSDCFA